MATFLFRNTIANPHDGIDTYWELTAVRQTAEFDSPLEVRAYVKFAMAPSPNQDEPFWKYAKAPSFGAVIQRGDPVWLPDRDKFTLREVEGILGRAGGITDAEYYTAYFKAIGFPTAEGLVDALAEPITEDNDVTNSDYFLPLTDNNGKNHVYTSRFLQSKVQNQAIQISKDENNELYFSLTLPSTLNFSDKVYRETSGVTGLNESGLNAYWKDVIESSPYNYVVKREMLTMPISLGFSSTATSIPKIKAAMIPLILDHGIYLPVELIDAEESLKKQQAAAQAQAQSAIDALGNIDDKVEVKKKNKTVSLSEQAILLYQLPTLASKNKKLRKLGIENKNNKRAMLYDRFAAIDTDKMSEMESLINTMTSPSSINALFDLIKPVHLSACIPRLRLFKLYVPDDPRVKDIENKDKLPRIAVEYEFDEHIRANVGDSSGKSSTNILGRTLSTNTGVGVEAFGWEFKGTNQFEAEKMVSANLKLRAQSINALDELKYSNSSGMNYKFSDLFIPEELPVDSKSSVPTPSKKDKSQYRAQTVKQYESRVLVEYGIDKKNPVFATADGKKVLSALEQLRLSLNLVITSYTLDLRDDGSVGVDINFIGRLEAHAMDPTFGSILPAKTAGEALKKRREVLKADFERQKSQNAAAIKNKEIAKQNLEKYIQEYNQENAGEDIKEDKTYQDLLNAISTIDKNIEETKDIKKFKDADDYLESAVADANRLQLYRTVYDKLIKKDSIRAISVDPRNIAANPLDNPSGCVVAEEADKLTKDMAAAAGTTKQKMSAGDANTKAWLEAGLREFQNKLSAISIPRFTDTHYVIPYIYFGDILDAVLDNMYELREDVNNDIRTILGPLAVKRNQYLAAGFKPSIKIDRSGKLSVIDDMGTNAGADNQEKKEKTAADSEALMGTKGDKKKPVADTQLVIANLADVPISFNLFLQWWAEKVSNKGLVSYSLKAFLSDAVQSLIVASLQASSTHVLLPQQNVRIKSTVWESATDRGAPDALGFTHVAGGELTINTGASKEEIYGYKPGSYFNLLNIEDLKSAADKKKMLPMTKPSLSGGGYESDYMLVYVETADWDRRYAPGRLVANISPPLTEYDRDIRDGIYHLESGKEAGMVKDIKMTAQTSEGYEEMQIMNAMKGGKRPVQRIYQATVTMHGVTFFRPGQTVYINAAAYGDFSTLLKFGLCGYYTVITTSCRISSGEFVTELECAFRSSGEHT